MLLGLWGVKCRKCGQPQYDNGAMSTPPIRVCAKCQSQDDFDDYCFSGRTGTVFSYTHDQLAPVVDPPASIVLVEFDGGGRAFFDLTDRDPSEIKVGTKVRVHLQKAAARQGTDQLLLESPPSEVLKETDEMAGSIKDRVAIVGMGCTKFGELWDKGPERAR